MNSTLMYNQVKKLVLSHGITCTFTKVVTGAYDPATGLVTNAETDTSITAFNEGFTASQFKYPSLIGKQTSMFYVLPDSLGATIPAANDRVTLNSEVFTIDSVSSHSAYGNVMLYILIAYK